MAEDELKSDDNLKFEDELKPEEIKADPFEPRIPGQVTIEEHHDRSLVRLAIFIIGAILIALILVLGARWIYHQVSNNSSTQNTSSGQKTSETSTNKTPAEPAPSASPNTGGSSSNSSTNNSGTKTNPSPSPTPSPNPNSLPNNGPGDIAKVFIVSSLGAAALHYGFRRKASLR